jgi:hypothetical protein
MGLTNWLDAQVGIPYISTKPDFSGLQDFSTYLKAAIWNKYYQNGSNFRFMLSAGTSFPLTDYNTENLFSIGQQAHALDGRIIMQYTASNGFFAMVQGGYTHREDPVPSSYPAAIKIGWARDTYYVDLWYDHQMAIGGNDYLDYRDERRATGSTDITFRSLGVSYGKAGITYYRPFGKSMGVALGASYVLWGRNVGQAFAFSASFIKRFSFSK